MLTADIVAASVEAGSTMISSSSVFSRIFELLRNEADSEFNASEIYSDVAIGFGAAVLAGTANGFTTTLDSLSKDLNDNFINIGLLIDFLIVGGSGLIDEWVINPPPRN